MLDKLYVVTPISNPVRYKSRYALYKNFEKMVKDAGADLYTVEVAYGTRPHEVTCSNNANHLQLRSWDEYWTKEASLNILLSRLPKCANYIAWVDSDVTFANPGWADETVQQLQHYDFVQMFSHAQDLGPKNEPVGAIREGFVHGYCHGRPYKGEYGTLHIGYSWAARRASLNKVGCLIDTAILGSADYYMGMALIGQAESALNEGFTQGYKDCILRWQDRAERHIRRNIGYVDGLLCHHWHGRKVNRLYGSRWKILVDNKFDPATDLYKDVQGLWQLDERKIKLRDDLRSYFRERSEDSIDV